MDVRDLASHNGRPILDSDHLGPLVLIFVPTFLCPAGLLVLSTIIVRNRAGANFSWQWSSPVMWDFLGLVSMLAFSTAWSAVICSQTQVGLGTITRPTNVELFEKYEYASELLYLLAIMFWKLTNGLCNANVFSIASARKGMYSILLTIVIALCFLAGLFAAAFQCNGPRFWAIRDAPTSQCFNRPAFWGVIGGIDILTDLILHGLIAFTIFKSHMVSAQKRTALTIVLLYLVTYVGTASVRLVFVTHSWRTPDYALIAARTAISTFSQLIFPMSVLCIGKLSKFLDLESYLSPAIGATSRKQVKEGGRDYYLRHYYGQNSANATGPVNSQRTQKRTFGDSVEELPLRKYRTSGELSKDGNTEGSDTITIKRDVIVSSENGSLNAM